LLAYGFGYDVCRQGGAGVKGQRHDLERKGTRESRAIPAPDANAELVLSMQVCSFLVVKLTPLVH